MPGGKYFFLCKLVPEKANNTAFANTLLGTLFLRNQDQKMSLECSVLISDDGQNHFWLRERA